MSPLPVIPDCYRVTWNFEGYAGVTPRTVQHFLSATGDEADLAASIWANIVEAQFGVMHENYEPQSIDILALDGTSPTQTFTRPDFDVQLCTSTGDSIPQAAAIVSWHTGQRGPRGRGRTFIGPCTEVALDDGIIDLTARVTMQTAWGTFITDCASDGRFFAVASYVHADANVVTGVVFQPVAGTQRRRIDQLR